MNYEHLNEVRTDYLEHYGVKGMKWDERKKRQNSASLSDSSRHSDVNGPIPTGNRSSDGVPGPIPTGNRSSDGIPGPVPRGSSKKTYKELSTKKKGSNKQISAASFSKRGKSALQSISSKMAVSLSSIRRKKS